MKTRMLFTATLVVALVALTTAASIALFSAETTNPTNKFASGTLVMSNTVNAGTACLSTGGGSITTNANANCDTLFNLTVKKPGDSGTADLQIKNEGSVDASALK